jgi:DNA mismatch repair protein MutS2
VREAAAGGVALDDAARDARRRVEDRARRESERTPSEPLPRTGGAGVSEGARVRVAASGLNGVVLELRDDRATVEVGGIRLQVPTSGLVLTNEPAPRGERVPSRQSAWTGPDVEASTEVDLRGLRAEDVAGRLNPAIDAAVQAALPSLRVIHGKGTGVLREVVTEIMSGDPRIRSIRPGGIGEGGTGVTVAELR